MKNIKFIKDLPETTTPDKINKNLGNKQDKAIKIPTLQTTDANYLEMQFLNLYSKLEPSDKIVFIEIISTYGTISSDGFEYLSAIFQSLNGSFPNLIVNCDYYSILKKLISVTSNLTTCMPYKNFKEINCYQAPDFILFDSYYNSPDECDIESIKKNVKMIIDWNNSPFENTMCSNLLHLIDNPENTYILTRNKKEIMPLVKAYIRERKR